jgi:hypothetical protein
MKQRIIVLIAVALSVMLFTGCDAILEVFFGEFGDNPNSLELQVMIDPAFTDTGNPVRIALIPYNPDDTIMVDQILLDTHFYAPEIWVTYDGLPHGRYQIYVWFDANDDGFADDHFSGYPGGLAFIDGSNPKVFEFVFNEEIDWHFAKCDLITLPVPSDPAPPGVPF